MFLLDFVAVGRTGTVPIKNGLEAINMMRILSRNSLILPNIDVVISTLNLDNIALVFL
jgi:hypothetical protein